jgi:thymidylate kinase
MSRTTRRSTKNKRDRLDTEKADFHARVREEYLRIARAEPHRVKVIDTAGTIEETQERLREIVVPFLQSRDQLTTRLVNSQPYKFKRGHC